MRGAHYFEQINNWGVAAVAEAVRHAGGTKKVIYLSSMAVYGPGEIRSVAQEPAPYTYYAVSKLRGERHIEFYFTRNIIIVRSPSVVGYSKAFRVESGFNRLVFDAVLRNVMLHEEQHTACFYRGSGDHLTHLVVEEKIQGAIGAILQL